MATPGQHKQVIAARLTERGRALLDALSVKLGLDRTGVIELAIRRLAEIERIELSEVLPPEKPKRK